MAQEFGSPPTYPPLDEPRRRSNTPLVITIVILVLLCCCCAFILASYFWLGDIFLQWMDEFGRGFSLLPGALFS